MGTDLISNLEKRGQKIATLRNGVEEDLKNGYVFESVPDAELSGWFKVLRFLKRLIGVNSVPPKRKRYLSESEHYRLKDRVNEIGSILIRINLELSKAKQNPELRRIPTGLVNYGDDGYPEDWEQISLQYRQRVGFICESCGSDAPDGHVHHILPVSRGGSSGEDNLLFLCKHCHSLQHPHMKEY